jgi:hypothetical protein
VRFSLTPWCGLRVDQFHQQLVPRQALGHLMPRPSHLSHSRVPNGVESKWPRPLQWSHSIFQVLQVLHFSFSMICNSLRFSLQLAQPLDQRTLESSRRSDLRQDLPYDRIAHKALISTYFAIPR